MKIVFLGTGGTYPSKMRNVASIAVQLPGEVIMFDCGEGTQRQLMRSSVSFMKISKVFITHLHADHFLGLPGLIQSMSLNGREDPLHIYGPEGTERDVSAMLSLGYFKPGYDITAEDLEPGTVLDFGKYTIRCAKAEHTVPSLAYSLEEKARPGRFNLKLARRLGVPEGPMFRRLQEGKPVHLGARTVTPEQVLGPPRRGRKIVYTGDTKPSDEIVNLARDADVLIHDCTLDSEREEMAAEFGHSTAEGAAGVAKAAGARVLYLVHVSPRFEDPKILENEARRKFKHSHVPSDLDEYEVRYRE